MRDTFFSRMDPVLLSALIHVSPMLLFAIVYWISRMDGFSNLQEFTVYEVPVVANQPIRVNPAVQPETKPKEEVKRAVFGVSKRAQLDTSGAADVPEVKAGNTVAKEQDQLKLTDQDEEALPIPTEEYLVSQMPRLENEFRIPYPAGARAKGVEGPVVMDLLIDPAGRVRKVDLVSGPGEGLNEAAVNAIVNFKFRPAEVDGKPVAVRIRYVYRFILER